jgi:hypothetical protein
MLTSEINALLPSSYIRRSSNDRHNPQNEQDDSSEEAHADSTPVSGTDLPPTAVLPASLQVLQLDESRDTLLDDPDDERISVAAAGPRRRSSEPALPSEVLAAVAAKVNTSLTAAPVKAASTTAIAEVALLDIRESGPAEDQSTDSGGGKGKVRTPHPPPPPQHGLTEEQQQQQSGASRLALVRGSRPSVGTVVYQLV